MDHRHSVWSDHARTVRSQDGNGGPGASGEEPLATEAASLTVNKITGHQEIARIQNDALVRYFRGSKRTEGRWSGGPKFWY